MCATLKNMRTHEKAAELYDKVKALCAANYIPESCAVTRHKQKKKHLEDDVVDSGCGAASDLGDARS